MPMSCRINFPRLSEDEMRAIDYRVMGHVFEVQKELGRLCDESVYQHCLADRWSHAGFEVAIEEPLELSFREFSTVLRLDLVVDHKVLYELKTVSTLLGEHEGQLLNYLFLLNANRGKLLNFRSESVETRFVNATRTTADRRQFEVDANSWRGDNELRELVVDLVRDWGTGLEQSLYSQALIECLGGEQHVLRQLPMTSNGRAIGQQRFMLSSDVAAFRITTYPHELPEKLGEEMLKMLNASPLERLDWINIGRHRLTIETLHRDA